MLGRLRGRSKAPEQGISPPATPHSGAAGGGGSSSSLRQGSTSPAASRQGSISGSPAGGSPRGSIGDRSMEGMARQGSVAGGGGGDAGSPAARPRRARGGDPLAALERDEELRRERILQRAATEMLDMSTVAFTNAIVLTRREGLGMGKSTGDMWTMKHIAQEKKKTNEAVEFSDSDGDAVRMLLEEGKLHICVNGTKRGEPKQFRWMPEEKTLRSRPWRIGLQHVKAEDLPLLLAHLGQLFSKAGIVHNLPTVLPEEEDDEVAELKRQMDAQRSGIADVMERLEKAKDAEAEASSERDKLRADVENLHGILGQKSDEASKASEELGRANTKKQTLQLAVDQAVAQRRAAEAQLAEKERECEVLKGESTTGRATDKDEIDDLTCKLGSALDDIGRYKLALADSELKVTELQNSLQQAVMRRQQAEQALADKETALSQLRDSLAYQMRQMEYKSGNDTELMERERRSAIEMEEHSKREYMMLWHNAETQIMQLKERHFEIEKMSLQHLEASQRMLLEAEERGRREYQGIWLRAELRNVANSTASHLERGAVLALKEKLQDTKTKLVRSRHALTHSIPVPHVRALAVYYRKLLFFALWRRFKKLAMTASSTLESHIRRQTLERAYLKWQLWIMEHTHDRTLAIKSYMQQRPIFYLKETIRRLQQEAVEAEFRRDMLSQSHLELLEALCRKEIEAERSSHLCDASALWLQAGTRDDAADQLDMLRALLRTEERKVVELEKTCAHVSRQRDDFDRHNAFLAEENTKIDVLRLLYAHLDGKRLIEVEHQMGIIDMLKAMLFPRRSICADGGWVLTSTNDWCGGGTWTHKYIWLDVKKGQMFVSSRDPRLSGGPDVKCIRLANVVSVEVELFTDGLTPPPVSRYQQLGFYVELAKGGKHRFCAATVGERTEWLNCLRRSLLTVWKTSESHITYVGAGGALSGTSPSSPPSPSYRKQRGDRQASLPSSVGGGGGGVRGGGGGGALHVPPLPLPATPRSPRGVTQGSESPRGLSWAAPSPYRRDESMPLEHQSYLGLP